MIVDFFSSAFCGPCHATRGVLAEASRLVPAVRVVERDVAAQPERSEQEGIRMTPTVVVRRDDGREVFRAEGAPSLDELLRALALAVS